MINLELSIEHYHFSDHDHDGGHHDGGHHDGGHHAVNQGSNARISLTKRSPDGDG